jgi:hypothetical protein
MSCRTGAGLKCPEIFQVAADAMMPAQRHLGYMAVYRVIPDHLVGRGFSAEVTFRSGHVETQRGFPTRAGALDWVGERLVTDMEPASEA